MSGILSQIWFRKKKVKNVYLPSGIWENMKMLIFKKKKNFENKKKKLIMIWKKNWIPFLE